MTTPTRTRLFCCALLVLPALCLAQRTSVTRDMPIYDNGGKPDLVMDPQRFVAQMEIVDRYFAPTDCALAEGVVGGSGYRRLLRFDTVVMNRGDGDLVLGDRSDPNNPYAEWFVFHPCHGHYHIRDFSVYELYRSDGVTLAAQGTKQGFCFEDSFKYEDGGKSHGYDCGYQGITSGGGTGTISSSSARGLTSPVFQRATTSFASPSTKARSAAPSRFPSSMRAPTATLTSPRSASTFPTRETR